MTAQPVRLPVPHGTEVVHAGRTVVVFHTAWDGSSPWAWMSTSAGMLRVSRCAVLWATSAPVRPLRTPPLRPAWEALQDRQKAREAPPASRTAVAVAPGRGAHPMSQWLRSRIAALQDRDGLLCYLCGGELADVRTLPRLTPQPRPAWWPTREHVVPTSRGGPRNDMSNEKVACEPCNLRKGDRLPSEIPGWPKRFPFAEGPP